MCRARWLRVSSGRGIRARARSLLQQVTHILSSKDDPPRRLCVCLCVCFLSRSLCTRRCSRADEWPMMRWCQKKTQQPTHVHENTSARTITSDPRHVELGDAACTGTLHHKDDELCSLCRELQAVFALLPYPVLFGYGLRMLFLLFCDGQMTGAIL